VSETPFSAVGKKQAEEIKKKVYWIPGSSHQENTSSGSQDNFAKLCDKVVKQNQPEEKKSNMWLNLSKKIKQNEEEKAN